MLGRPIENDTQLSAEARGPVRIDSEDDIVWDENFDVVVVGFGSAGACAALQASEQGASVAIIDRFSGGGTTAYSGGIIYAGETETQRDAGIDDSAEEMFHYLSLQTRGVVSNQTLWNFCHGSKSDHAWLRSYGVKFNSNICVDKTSFPPEDKFLYFSGNERLPEFEAIAKPAPRGHRVVGSGFTGRAYFSALNDAVANSSAKIYLHTLATRLIVNNAGEVLGVEVSEIPPSKWRKHQYFYDSVTPYKPFKGQSYEAAIQRCREFEAAQSNIKYIRARGGVILATGGFIYNLAMINQDRPQVAKCFRAIIRMGSIGDDGSGILLGQSVGGELRFMDSLSIGRTIAPPSELIYGIAVNSAGNRFVAEDSYHGMLGNSIAVQPAGVAWVIIDHDTFKAVLRQCFSRDWTAFVWFLLPFILNILFGGKKRARSLEGLAKKCGIPTDALVTTVRNHNHVCQTGASDPLGKMTNHMRAIDIGPYHAVNISLSNRFSLSRVFTLGGLVVDEVSGAVRRANGNVIEGLFAAGRTAIGLCSKEYVSGLSLADGIFSGRRAGENAAARARSPLNNDIARGETTLPPMPKSRQAD